MPTHWTGTERERQSLDTMIKLVRATSTLANRLAGPLQREHGITETQLAVLESLHHLGPMSQGQLCGKILKSGSNVTTVLDNLERDGLVRRERDARDRRVQIVHLTPAGFELIQRVLPGHVERVAEAFDALTGEEQLELGRLCRKLGTSLAR